MFIVGCVILCMIGIPIAITLSDSSNAKYLPISLLGFALMWFVNAHKIDSPAELTTKLIEEVAK